MGCSPAATKTITVAPYSNPVPATPGAPTLVSYGTPTGPQGGSVTFGWNAVPGSTSYEIFHSGAPQTAGVTINGTQATVTGLYAPGTVTFGVVACNSAGCSQEGPTTSFTVPAYTAPTPGQPQNIQVSGLQTNPTSANPYNITISWTPADNYATYFTVNGTNVGNVTSASMSVTPGNSYPLSVEACN